MRTYDAIDRLTRLVHESVSGTTATVLASWDIQRAQNGNPTRVTRENGEVFEYAHDNRDQLIRVQMPRNMLNRLRAENTQGGDEDDDDIPYRGMTNGQITYQYSPAGNRTTETYDGRMVAAASVSPTSSSRGTASPTPTTSAATRFMYFAAGRFGQADRKPQ